MNKKNECFELCNTIGKLNIWSNSEKNEDDDCFDNDYDSDEYSSMALYGKILRLSKESEQTKVYNLENETGSGKISVHKVFPGIELVYNDIHMEYCNEKQKIIKNAIEINHCREGRYECSYSDRGCCYVSQGDLSICSLKKKKVSSHFPLSHYHGITIVVRIEEIPKELIDVFNMLSIDLDHIKLFICDDNRYCVMRANKSIEHIFSELYNVKNQRKAGYMKIKVLELLLFLSDLNADSNVVKVKYCRNNNVKIVKEVKKIMIDDISRHYTIEELAKNFDISASTLKTCFKDIYGESIYSYVKNYRLQVAQRLLLESNSTITEIAEDIGYKNPNKFTSAFKKEYGIAPSEYRKNILLDRNSLIWSGEKC